VLRVPNRIPLANRRAADLYAYEIAPIIAELKASGIVLPRAIGRIAQATGAHSAGRSVAPHHRCPPACASTLTQAELLPTPEAKVHGAGGHGRSADTSAVLIEPTTKRALVDIALLSIGDDGVQPIASLSAELLRIGITQPSALQWLAGDARAEIR
jgi:hypothetical protein